MEEQRKFPHKNVITRALGMRDTVQVDIVAEDIGDGTFPPMHGWALGMLPELAFTEHLKVGADLDAAVTSLVAAANAAGGVDNITALVLECRQD